VGTLSDEDLAEGMELARLAGEMQVASRIVGRLQMRVLRDFLESRGAQLSDMAVANIVRSAGTRVLASAMAVTGAELGALSAQEVAEGIARAAAGGLRDASDRLGVEAEIDAIRGVSEVAAAQEMRAAGPA
jgi:hypothetical protein